MNKNSDRIVSVRRSTSGRLHTCKNAYGVKVKRCCASCQHKCVEKDGTRVCSLTMMEVQQRFKCKQWQMSDGMKNAGKGGGVVRLKGTTEIIIQ